MALSRSLSHTLANLISLVSLSNGGEGYEFCNRSGVINLQNVNPKQRHGAGRVWAASRASGTSRVSRTIGSQAQEKDGAKGDGKVQVEVTENLKEQEREVSASSARGENRIGDIKVAVEGKGRRRRRTRAEIEAEAKLRTVEDFFRELDSIGESFETEKLHAGTSPETSPAEVEDSSGTSSAKNGAVQSKTKRKPRAKKILKADNVLPESNGRTPTSVAPGVSELVCAEISAEEGSASVGSVAREHHEDVEVKVKETKINSLGGQKPSSPRKRSGRRERAVLARKAAEAKAAALTSNDRSEAEDVSSSLLTHRLSQAGTEISAEPYDGSHGNSAGGSSTNDNNVEANVDGTENSADPSDGSHSNSASGSSKNDNNVEANRNVPLATRDSSKTSHLNTLTPIHGEIHEQEKPNSINGPVEDARKFRIAGAGSGLGAVLGAKAEEIPSENLEEFVIPVRKSGAKRRRQREKRAFLNRESGNGEGGQEGPVQSETNAGEGQPFDGDDFDPITWCTVHFKVQADLETNQRLCVVGANPELGAWDLSLALPLLKSQDGDCEDLWENTIKVPQGMMLEYKYFVEAAGAEKSSVDRKFGPEIQYFIPQLEFRGTSIEVIKDTWRPEYPVKLHSLSWGSRWWEQIDLSDPVTEVENESNSGASTGEEEIHSDLSEADNLIKVEAPDEESQNVGAGPTVTAEGEKSVSGTETGKGVDEWLRRKIRKKALPREEPWLIESMIMAQRNDLQRKKAEEKEDGKLHSIEAAEVEQKKDLSPVQVEILINSPPCTMQRMAILEDGKLVELLLEPVNTRVQVGNVYLGVVRQLLPGMSGVFVDIGGFQLALLDITRNQYPYTFPNLNGGASNVAPVTFDGTFEGDVSEDEDTTSSDDCEYFVDGDEESLGSHAEEEKLVEDIRDEIDIEDDYIVDDFSLKEGMQEATVHSSIRSDAHSPGPITVNFGRKLKKWRKLEEGMQIIVQVKKEALGKKGPRLTAFPSLAGRFWVLVPRGRTVGVSRRITGPERRRLRSLAVELQPRNFGLTIRTEALGHDREELERDLARLLETWKDILDLAASSAVAAEHDAEGPVPVLLHRAMGQTLTIVRDFFNTKVHRMVIDSAQCFQEVTSYLQEVAPDLCDRVELYTGVQPIFDAYNLETEIDKFSSKRVNLPNGAYLIVEETEALVSIDVNGGTGMLAQDISQGEAILEVNLAAARQIAVELRLRDIGGIIVVDFIDMDDPSHHKLVCEEMRKAIQGDRSTLNLSEISEFGLMEMTRKRVRPSVTLTISEPCPHCHGVGRVEAHETTLSRIERAVRRLLAAKPVQAEPSSSSKWPQFLLRVDPVMGEYLKARKRKRMTQLSAALKVWLILKVALEFHCGYFQVLEQRGPQERRVNAIGQNKVNAQNTVAMPAGGLLSKRVWTGKRRRNFGNQVYSRESWPSNEL